MKMKFIPLLFVLGCIASNSQITTTGGAKFFVSPSTTVFSTGDIIIGGTSGVFTNKGNVKISEGALKNNGSPENFVLTYTGEHEYGQLIIVNETHRYAQNIGKITIQKPLKDYGSGEILFGIPFVNYTYKDFSGDLTNNTMEPDLVCGLFGVNNNCKNNPDRWKRHPLFTWNEDRFRYDPFQVNENFVPGKYYAFRREKFDTGTNFNSGSVTTFSFKGAPYVAGTKPTDGNLASPADLSLSVNNRVAGGYKIGNKAKNEYGIYYMTYLDDPFVTLPAQPGGFLSIQNDVLDSNRYWDRIIRMVNPYTSNLSLNKLLENKRLDIVGVASDGPLEIAVTNGKTRYKGKSQVYTISPSGWPIGDDLSIIPPMTNFLVKANKDDVKIDLYQSSYPQTFSTSKYEFEKGDVKSPLLNRSNAPIPDLYQLNLVLTSGKTYYGNTYLAAGSDLITGELSEQEARNKSNKDDVTITSIYTIPESINGGKYPGYEETELYINVINSDNSSKVAVPLGVNVSDMDRGKEFTFTSELKYNMNFLEEGKTNFDNPNAKFYFHDKQIDVVKEIDSNFSYSVTLNESTKDRFEIFWKEPGTLGNEDIKTLNGLTIIYKSGNEHKVHFDKSWQKAEVSVFNVLGQLISTEKNINTQNDYLLPIHTTSSSLYVIVVTNQITGEKVTKKIVK